jgi:hypothetical protein
VTDAAARRFGCDDGAMTPAEGDENMDKRTRHTRRPRRHLAAGLALAGLAVLLLATAGPAVASRPGGPHHRVRPFDAFVTVTATNSTESTFTATVNAGNRTLRIARGTSAAFTVPAAARILKKAAGHRFAPATFADIAVGDRLHVVGRADFSGATPVYRVRLVLDWGPKPVKTATTP